MKEKVSKIVIILRLLLFVWDVVLPVPGSELTTFSSLEGERDSETNEKYNAIEEYINGDAYNYIIGASLVAGEIASAKIQKTICISVGLLIASMGALSFAFAGGKLEINVKKPEENSTEVAETPVVEAVSEPEA